ncbi:MAG: hypothetical protein Q7R40_06755 [Phaeospirillum sp.]|nr:hypothetical protein [Phaeospirillum sp.]
MKKLLPAVAVLASHQGAQAEDKAVQIKRDGLGLNGNLSLASGKTVKDGVMLLAPMAYDEKAERDTYQAKYGKPTAEAVKPLADGKPVKLVTIPNADHFFLDLAADDAADAIKGFLVE